MHLQVDGDVEEEGELRGAAIEDWDQLKNVAIVTDQNI